MKRLTRDSFITDLQPKQPPSVTITSGEELLVGISLNSKVKSA